MNKRQLLLDSFWGWISSIWLALRAGLSIPLTTTTSDLEDNTRADPDFEGWLHGDPMVTKNPTSRYGNRTPGYITGNGLGSMEIGAADD